MTYIPNVSQLQRTNSTSFVDVLGLQVGLDRLPGESSGSYLKRIEVAARSNRKHPYEGMANEVNLQLGFQPSAYISVQLPTSITISSSIAGVVIEAQPVIPLLTFDDDDMWRWRMLSDIVSDISKVYPSTLLVADGPAFQLARQTNSSWSFSESVSQIRNQLLNVGVRVGSELFNQSVPSYTLTADGLLTFSTEPNPGTTITYNYISTPYNLVGTPVAAIGLVDPEFASVANSPDGALAYQVREFLQAIMLIDRSYWAK